MAGSVDDAPRQLQERDALAQRFGTDNIGSVHAAGRATPVQRLIVIPKSELDYGMIVNVYQMLKNEVDERVTVLEAMHKAKLEPGEPLHMAGHGYTDEGAYGGLSVAVLSEYFAKSNIPASIETIHLLSCSTGRGREKSYAAQLAKALKGRFAVTANQNLSYTDEEGRSHSKRERTPKEGLEYKAIFAKCTEQVEAAKALAAEAKSEILEVASKEVGSPEKEITKTFMHFGAEILKVAGDLFHALYKHQKQLINPDGKYRHEKEN